MGEVRAVALPAIRKDIPAYLAELKRWLDETRNAPLAGARIRSAAFITDGWNASFLCMCEREK